MATAVRVYLDHAASTALRPQAHSALDRWLRNDAGNPSSVHRAGQDARVAVEEARERVAACLGALPSEIVFTSGGTEADNLALKGLAWAGRDAGRTHVVVSEVEHAAVGESARWLAERDGFALTVVPPRRDGTLDPDRVLAAVRPDTAVVSVMAANNELGAVNDVAAIGAALRERGVAFHVDAVQAVATLEVDVSAWPCDALALSAHKFGGPVGVGIAYLRRGVPVVPVSHGGGQERGVRSGTMTAALDAALAAALVAVTEGRDVARDEARRLTDRLADGIAALAGVRRNGPADAEGRLASHLHVSIEGVDGEALMWALDDAGVCVSTGAACGAGATKTSHVLAATGLDDLASVRASVGWNTTTADIDAAVDTFCAVVGRLRAAGGGAVIT